MKTWHFTFAFILTLSLSVVSASAREIPVSTMAPPRPALAAPIRI